MYYFFLFIFLLGGLFSSGISYRSEEIDFFTTAHILEVDPEYFYIKAVRAREKDGVFRQTVLSIAREHRAIAAINGGFWKKDGKAAGILKILDQWHGFAIKKRCNWLEKWRK